MQKIDILYDGQCVICRNSVRMVGLLDWFKRFNPLDLQQDDVREQYPEFSYEDLMGAMHLITPEGRALKGFFAVRFEMRYLPLLWPLLPLAYFPGMNWLGPKLYAWVARNRYAINKLVGNPVCDDGYCKIP